MANELQPITDTGKLKELAEQEAVSVNLAKQFFMKGPNGEIFIRRAGLLYKTEKKFKQTGYSVRTEVPSEEEMKRLRMMLGIGEGEPCAIMKGVVTAGGETYTDYGTATSRNTNKTTVSYLLEMACTRATNRAMRIATVCGFTSAEEVAREPIIRPVQEVDYDGKPVIDTRDMSTEESEPEPEPDPDDTPLDDLDYQALQDYLAEHRIEPWVAMEFVTKRFGIKRMRDVTYRANEVIVEAVETGELTGASAK